MPHLALFLPIDFIGNGTQLVFRDEVKGFVFRADYLDRVVDEWQRHNGVKITRFQFDRSLDVFHDLTRPRATLSEDRNSLSQAY